MDDLTRLIQALPAGYDGQMAYLVEHDLLALTVPVAFGGHGLALAQAVALTFALARRSGSAGLTYAMHAAQLHTWGAHVKGNAYLADQLRDTVAGRRLVASVVSEPATGGDIHRATASLGAVLHKTTSNTSYVPQAGAFLVTAVDMSGPRPVQCLVMVRADATLMQELRRNRMMGMTDIYNAAWQFEFTHPPEAVFADAFTTIASATMTPATHLLWAALWSGLAARALDTAHHFAKAELPAEVAAQLQLKLSDLRNKHYVLNALIRDNLGPASNRFAAAANINRLKIVGSQNATEIALGCLTLIGLRAYAEDGPYSLSQVVRDVLSGPLMVANARLQANTASIDRYSEDQP